jgi:hypothetical protein
MNITDHGENDPLDFTLTKGWQAVARFGREAIEANRQARNDEDAQRGVPNLFDAQARSNMAKLAGVEKAAS